MAREYYRMPDYVSTTSDVDSYVEAWRTLAKPIEQKLGLSLTGFDPDFCFTKGNVQTGASTNVMLPVWFVRELSAKLGEK